MAQKESESDLTFTRLDAEIQALPEGPVSMLRWPRWMRPWTAAGVVGMLIGLSPSLLIQWLEAAGWMVTVVRLGLFVTIIGFAPTFVRSIWILLKEFSNQRRGFVEQFDHDAAQLHRLAIRLSAYPHEILERRKRFARMGYERMGSRLVMMLGGIERLGILPLLLALFVMLRNWQDLLAIPIWLAGLATMAAILWVIGWGAAEFHRRLQLYEFILEEALTAKAEESGVAR